MLSTFEAALLERHLRRCGDCRAFAADVTSQTQLLRAAVLEEPSRAVTVVPSRQPQFRRHTAGVAAAALVATMAALLTLTSTGGHRTATSSGTGKPLLAVFPAQPRVDATFDVARLRVVSPASADGPVHGDYGIPVLYSMTRAGWFCWRVVTARPPTRTTHADTGGLGRRQRPALINNTTGKLPPAAPAERRVTVARRAREARRLEPTC